MNKFNNNLKHYREIYGFTQKSLADKLGITIRAYQRYESGEREPKLDVLINIANIFHISLDELVGREFSQSSLVDTE